jgi:hypothetical protein
MSFLYAVHGALHLVGHLDKQPAESAAMRSAERAVLERLDASCLLTRVGTRLCQRARAAGRIASGES